MSIWYDTQWHIFDSQGRVWKDKGKKSIGKNAKTVMHHVLYGTQRLSSIKTVGQWTC